MREIKFRGKRKGGTEILIGDLVHTCNGGPCIFPHDNTLLGLNSPDWYEVDPETVGQFTGLKDKNGNEIFEGDTIKIEQGECVGISADGSEEEWIKVQGLVLFEDAMFVFEGHSAGTLPLSAYKDDIELIKEEHL